MSLPHRCRRLRNTQLWPAQCPSRKIAFPYIDPLTRTRGINRTCRNRAAVTASARQAFVLPTAPNPVPWVRLAAVGCIELERSNRCLLWDGLRGYSFCRERRQLADSLPPSPLRSPSRCGCVVVSHVRLPRRLRMDGDGDNFISRLEGPDGGVLMVSGLDDDFKQWMRQRDAAVPRTQGGRVAAPVPRHLRCCPGCRQPLRASQEPGRSDLDGSTRSALGALCLMRRSIPRVINGSSTRGWRPSSRKRGEPDASHNLQIEGPAQGLLDRRPRSPLQVVSRGPSSHGPTADEPVAAWQSSTASKACSNSSAPRSASAKPRASRSHGSTTAA